MNSFQEQVRALGKALQESPVYIRYVAAWDELQEDQELMEQQKELELVRMQYLHESEKDTPDEEFLRKKNQEFQVFYDQIMKHPCRKEYQIAATALQEEITWASKFLTGCAKGEDPAHYEPPAEEDGCGGGCGSCGGCGH